MGLLLSVLVACVGVVELLAFYTNVTRSFVTVATQTNFSHLTNKYVEGLEHHRRNLENFLFREVQNLEECDNLEIKASETDRHGLNQGQVELNKEAESQEIVLIAPSAKDDLNGQVEVNPTVIEVPNGHKLDSNGQLGTETQTEALEHTRALNATKTSKVKAQTSLVFEEKVVYQESKTKEPFAGPHCYTKSSNDDLSKGKLVEKCTEITFIDLDDTVSLTERQKNGHPGNELLEYQKTPNGTKTDSSLISVQELLSRQEAPIVAQDKIANKEAQNQNGAKPVVVERTEVTSNDLHDDVTGSSLSGSQKFQKNTEACQKTRVDAQTVPELKESNVERVIPITREVTVIELETNGLSSDTNRARLTNQKVIPNETNAEIQTLSESKPQDALLEIQNNKQSPASTHNVPEPKLDVPVLSEHPQNEEIRGESPQNNGIVRIDVGTQTPRAQSPQRTDLDHSVITEPLDLFLGEFETREDGSQISRSFSPQSLAEEDSLFRRSPSPYPFQFLSVPRNSICSESAVPEVDEESDFLSKSPTPEKFQLLLESKHNSTEFWSNQILIRSHSPLPLNTEPVVVTKTEFTLENAIEIDDHFLDSLDGVKKKKLERSSSSRRSRKKKTSESKEDSLSSSSAQTAKTLTEAANVLKSGDSSEAAPGTSKDSAGEPFWLIFSGEYTKAMNKDWHGQHFCCWQCDESLTGQRYVLRDEHPYCVSCYESVFANACEKCSRTIGIDSKDLSYKDKHWHEACFLCTTCGESLVDRQFGSKGDRIYCGRCYDEQFASRCDGCHEIFRAGTKKMEYKTRQWHEKCFCCCVCKVPIGTQSFIPREQEIYCAKCYEEKFATRCIKCNKVITSGGVTYKNEPWHRECFTCTHCSKSLAGERFTSRDEKPYCAECFGELFAKRCFACNKPITGIGGTKFISFEDRHWHNDCFFCASCRTSLVGRGFITDQEDIICPECAKQKLM